MGQVITLKWRGEEYTLNENEAFLACDAVEDIMTLGDTVEMLQGMGKMKFVKIARAYGALLREAGASVSDKEIHDEFKSALQTADKNEKLVLAKTALLTLIQIIMGDAPASSAEDKQPKNAKTSAS